MSEGNGATAFADFPSSFKGVALRPQDSGYAEAREIPNARWVDRVPALIARATDADDIVTAVNYAVEKDVSIAVRSGGHAIDGHAMPHDAFVIDMSLMKQIQVDPETGVTTLQAGVLLGEMDAATQAHGYVVPAGTVSQTGAAGLTLGGGIGYLTRRCGTTVDNLLSADVVTVDGRKLTCSQDENPELFWGLKGAGHNLAIATSFTYQAHQVGPEVMSGLIIYPIEAAVPILGQIDEVLANSPRELTIYPVVLPAPPLPGLPEQMIGVPIFVLIIVYTGALDAYESAMAATRKLGQPLADMVHPSSWMEANSILDVLAPPNRRQWSRGGYLPGMSAEIGQVVVERAMDTPAPTGPGPSVAVAFPLLGGALFDFEEDSCAFSRTGAEWLWETLGQWDPVESDGEYEGWVDGTMDALAPYSLKNGYVNLSTDRGAEWLRGLYGSEEKWKRICALKQQWDPENRLAHNKNVARAMEPVAA
ncbi:MAG TPA: FAD-binding oxidoreductase [Solirubrobacteraceae bacterium]|nr:FAD-binding oxidoreductase [Solirubrobacteraceae bacterium]